MKKGLQLPRSIVILRALQLGDLLCTVPTFRALRHHYPHARITLIGLPWAAEFVHRFSAYLDDFITFPGWPGLPEQEVQPEQVPAFLSEVQKRRFDLALQMQGDGRLTNPLTLLFGARQTVGFIREEQPLTGQGNFFPYPDGEHEIRIFLKLAEHLGIAARGEQLEFPITADERAGFEAFRQDHDLQPGTYICLHPGARNLQRRWSPEKFAALGDQLAERGYRVALTGTAPESAVTQQIAARMQHPALDLAGKTNLANIALLIESARMLISNDTGVSHIAAALHTPSVVLFSVSEPHRWRPLDHALHPILTDADNATPDQVLEQVDLLLQKERDYAA